MVEGKPDQKNVEQVTEQDRPQVIKPPEMVRMDDPASNKTFKQVKEKENAQTVNALTDTGIKKEVAVILSGVSISKPQDDPKKDGSKSGDPATKDNPNNKN